MKLLKMVPDHTNLDFMRWRNFALILSLIVTVISIGYTAYRGLNLGVDFVGGQLVRVTHETWMAPWSYYLMAPAAHFRRPIVRSFVDWAHEEARGAGG